MATPGIGERLVAIERRREAGAGGAARAAFRVCDKLRPLLSTLAGAAGHRSLLARAVVLARARAPWLAELELGEDGAVRFPVELESRIGSDEVARGGRVLVDELLGLLGALIGEALTLRLLRNVWPEIVFPPSSSTPEPP
jgi:hypothetical protein